VKKRRGSMLDRMDRIFDFIVGALLNSTALSGCTPFSVLFPLLCRVAPRCRYGTLFTTLCAALPITGEAAWRSGGFHYLSSGVQIFNSALPFLRASCRRCAKPRVICWHFSSFFVSFYNSNNIVEIHLYQFPIFPF
jgi:hypothetical protein